MTKDDQSKILVETQVNVAKIFEQIKFLTATVQELKLEQRKSIAEVKIEQKNMSETIENMNERFLKIESITGYIRWLSGLVGVLFVQSIYSFIASKLFK
jgi:hypothetical protein